MDIRHLLRRVSHRLPLSRLVALSGQRLFLPVYHLVTADRRIPPHIASLYRPRNAAEFRRDLNFLLRHFRPISLGELVRQLETGRPFSRPAFHLSFDDGLREVLDVAAPILAEKGVPASLFVNPAFVGNSKLFFRFKVALLIDATRKDASRHATLTRQVGRSDLGTYLLSLTHVNIPLIDNLAGSIGLSFEEYLYENRPYLMRHELADWIAAGHSVGGHSTNHPYFSRLTLEEQLHQARASMHWVTQNFPDQLPTFAFPFTDHGVSAAFFEKFYRDEDDHEPVLSFGSAGIKRDIHPRHLQRTPMEVDEFPTAEAVVTAEYAYYLAKAGMGKNKIRRT